MVRVYSEIHPLEMLMELEWIREHEWHTFSKGKPKFHKQVSYIASGQGSG